MVIQLTNVTNALQKIILPYIRDNFNKQTILIDQLKRADNLQVINNTFYSPIRSSRHGGITNLANDGSTLVSGSSSIGQASVNVKTMTGTFDITDLVLQATKSNKSAVENQLTFQARTLASDFAKDFNRQAFGDGVGVLAQVLASGGSVGVGTIGVTYPDANLDDGRSIDNYGTVNGDMAITKYIQPGMRIGVGTAGAAAATVSSVTGTSIVTTGAVVTAANDAIYRLDGDNAGAGTSELTGIRAALSSSTGTSTYAGLARSTPGWTPQVGTTAEALTLSAIEDKYLAAREYGEMGDRYAIFMNRTLYKKYGDILTSMRREVNETDLLGGWTGLSLSVGAGKVGVFLDYDCPDGEVLIINLDTWQICQVTGMRWLEGPDGGSLIRRRDALSYQATMVWYLELMCLAPAANGRLTQKTA